MAPFNCSREEANQRLVIMGIPLETQEFEIINFLTNLYPGETFENLTIHTPKRAKNWGREKTQFGFVDCSCTRVRNLIVDSFPSGENMTNLSGKTGRLYFHPCKMKEQLQREQSERASTSHFNTALIGDMSKLKKSFTELSFETDQKKTDEDINHNVVMKSKHVDFEKLSSKKRKEVEELMTEYKEFLEFNKKTVLEIEKLEDTLKCQLPTLYTSEGELRDLMNHEETLKNDIKKLQGDLRHAQDEFQNVSIQVDCLKN